jgi:FkbM family methyltransferase
MKLSNLKGVIHVGANTGQELSDYAARDFNVLWIEPIPTVFEQLKENVRPYPKQHALNYLVGDEDDKPITMHVCDNEGLSSSIMDFAQHPVVYPSVHFTHDIECRMWTLDSIIGRENIDLKDYDGMVIDVQGAEMKVLKGAGNVLKSIKRLRIESADFELYKDYPTPKQLIDCLNSHGLVETGRDVFGTYANHKGKCFDINFARQ